MTEKYSQKWAVASFFNGLEEGFTFHRFETPLHVTLAGVFELNRSGGEILKIIEESIRNLSDFEVQAGEVEKWGELKVNRIGHSEELEVLYRTIQQELLDNGAVFNEPQYLLEGFKTHSTHQRAGRLRVGDNIRINSVSLVDMFPDGDWQKRRIIGTLQLGKPSE